MTIDREKLAVDLDLKGTPYGWTETFKYGGQEEGSGPWWVLPASGTDEFSRWKGIAEKTREKGEPFDLEDVEKVEKSVEGENDGADWVAFGTLKNGLWFCITAGCDYTGWG